MGPIVWGGDGGGQCIIEGCVATIGWDIGGGGVCWDTMYHRGCVGW